MQIHPLTVPFAALSLVISVAVPIILLLIFSRSERLSWRVIGIGGATWFIATQVLEKMFHSVILKYTGLFSYPYLFAVYGALAAGIFEEAARYYVFNKYLKEHRQWKDGIAFGLGHGGLESILLGVMGGTQILTFVGMIQKGTFAQLNGKVPPQMIHQIQTTLQSSPFVFLLGGIERVFALFVQILMSLIVLYAVKHRKIKFLFYAIGLHAMFDLAPAFYQMGKVPLWFAETIVGIFAVVCAYLIFKLPRRI